MSRPTGASSDAGSEGIAERVVLALIASVIPPNVAGSVVAGYRIEEVAGRGSMGVVYRATQLVLQRPVALKLIATESAHDASFRERFKRESQLAASIDHPNVIPIYEAGEVEGSLFLAMRFVEGTDLGALIGAHGALDPAHAVRIVAQVAAGLSAAHALGLVHRDVKPANVLIAAGADEHVYLADFGLTKHASSAGGLTQPGMFVGTLDYSAPEVIRGDPVDSRADVYALGCVLFHCLTGHPPFVRDSDVATMYAHLHDDAPAPSTLAGIPAALDAVVAKALAKDPDERYATAAELGRAARAALGEPAAAAPSAPASPAAPATPAEPAAPAAAPSASGSPAAAGAPAEPAMPAAAASAPASPAAAASPAPASPAAPAPPAAPAAAPNAPASPAAARTADADREGMSRDWRIVLLTTLGLAMLAGLVAAVLVGAGVLGGAGGEEAAAPPAKAAQAAPAKSDAAEKSAAEKSAAEKAAAEKAAAEKAAAEKDAADPSPAPGTPRPTAAISVGHGPDGIAVDDAGSVWVTNARDDTLTRIDERSGRVVGQPIAAGDDPDGVVAAKGVVWLASAKQGRVLRFETAGDAPVPGGTIDVGAQPEGIALGRQLVWVANIQDGTVNRIDRASPSVVGAPIGVGNKPTGVFVGSSVWVTNNADATVTRIDPSTAQVVGAPIPVGREPRGVVEGEGSVWVANSGDDTVSRLDPRSGRAIGTPIKVGRNPRELTVGLGFVWVANNDDNSVTRIDPRTGKVVGTATPVGKDPLGIAAGSESVWVVNHGDDTVTRIEP
jgi:DNA-binding beta-propeller fold protein YncE